MCLLWGGKSLQLLYSLTLLYHTECYERDRCEFAFLRELLNLLKYFHLICNLIEQNHVWAVLKPLPVQENSGWGDHRGWSSLISCTRQGQAKTCVKPVWCVTCSWKKNPQKPIPHVWQNFGKYFPSSSSALSSLLVLCKSLSGRFLCCCFPSCV